MALLLAAAVVAGGLTGCTDDRDGAAGRKGMASRVLGSHGPGPGRFDRPRTLTCLPDGTIWVADMTGRVQALDYEGNHLATIRLPDTTRGKPTGLAFDGEGNLLVAETHYSRVSRWSRDGNLLSTWGGYGKEPGKFVLVTGIATGPGGHVYVAEQGEWNDRVQKFTAGGEFVMQFGSFGEEPGQFRRPAALAIDEEGFIYVADAVNHRVQKFDADGKLVAVWGKLGRELGEFAYPYGLTLGADGVIYTCEFQNNRVQAITRDGEFLGSLGHAGLGLGEFRTPKGITAGLDGELLVADTNNHRLQVVPTGFWKD